MFFGLLQNAWTTFRIPHRCRPIGHVGDVYDNPKPFGFAFLGTLLHTDISLQF